MATAKPHTLRIIGGTLKRTPITVLDAPHLRPTPDRVRETLYNWITHLWQGQFSDKSVLDLFAGSGALGFEAASRGVAHVQMVEPNNTVRTALRAFRDKHQLTQVRIHSGTAELVLERMDASRFDLILLDPPFGQGFLEKVKPYLANLCTPHALVYVESETAVDWGHPFELLRHGKAGLVSFQLFAFNPTQEIA